MNIFRVFSLIGIGLAIGSFALGADEYASLPGDVRQPLERAREPMAPKDPDFRRKLDEIQRDKQRMCQERERLVQQARDLDALRSSLVKGIADSEAAIVPRPGDTRTQEQRTATMRANALMKELKKQADKRYEELQQVLRQPRDPGCRGSSG